MKRPYLRNYTRYIDGIDIRIITIPKFIFIFHTYMGSKCSSFDAIEEKSYFWRPSWISCHKKMLNTYKLAYIRYEISTLKLTRIHFKTLYMVPWPLAQTIILNVVAWLISCLRKNVLTPSHGKPQFLCYNG